jgi:hypothetical protein
MSHITPKPAFVLFPLSIRLAALFSAFAVGVYAYLGIFSRHLADDYCSFVFVRSNFFTALWNNYLNVSDRFSGFMLIALSESAPRSVAVLPALMLFLWVLGIAMLFQDAGFLSKKGRSLPWVLSFMLVFFVLLQTSNRYQTLYWRSSMATHFAPLVFLPYFASFLLRCIQLYGEKGAFSRWMYPLSFLLAFLLGGFSEPPVVVMIVLLGCAMIISLLETDVSRRSTIVAFLACSLAGALAALVVMALAPANLLRLGSSPPALSVLISRSFLYAYQFLLNSFIALPLPAFFTIFTPFIVFYGLHAATAVRLTQAQTKRLVILLAVIPVLSYLLIVVSFAPSVYGQSFPVERARFAGQLCLVAALMIEGAGLGILLAQWRLPLTKILRVDLICMLLLGITALYPLRAALLALGDLPEYRERAELWDLRDAYILKHAALGETDIIVPGFSGVYGIKELDDDQNHWVNICAAQYYGVNSIRTVPVPDEYLREFFSE